MCYQEVWNDIMKYEWIFTFQGEGHGMLIESMTTKEVWAEIDEQLRSNSAPYEELNVMYVLHLTGDDGGRFGLRFTNGAFEIVDEPKEESDCRLILSVSNFKKLLLGNLNTTASFMTGKLKVKGNIALTLKLEGLLKQYHFS